MQNRQQCRAIGGIRQAPRQVDHIGHFLALPQRVAHQSPARHPFGQQGVLQRIEQRAETVGQHHHVFPGDAFGVLSAQLRRQHAEGDSVEFVPAGRRIFVALTLGVATVYPFRGTGHRRGIGVFIGGQQQQGFGLGVAFCHMGGHLGIGQVWLASQQGDMGQSHLGHAAGAGQFDGGECGGGGAVVLVQLTQADAFLLVGGPVPRGDGQAVVPGGGGSRCRCLVLFADQGHQARIAAAPVVNGLLWITHQSDLFPGVGIQRIATRQAAGDFPLLLGVVLEFIHHHPGVIHAQEADLFGGLNLQFAQQQAAQQEKRVAVVAGAEQGKAGIDRFQQEAPCLVPGADQRMVVAELPFTVMGWHLLLQGQQGGQIVLQLGQGGRIGAGPVLQALGARLAIIVEKQSGQGAKAAEGCVGFDIIILRESTDCPRALGGSLVQFAGGVLELTVNGWLHGGPLILPLHPVAGQQQIHRVGVVEPLALQRGDGANGPFPITPLGKEGGADGLHATAVVLAVQRVQVGHQGFIGVFQHLGQGPVDEQAGAGFVVHSKGRVEREGVAPLGGHAPEDLLHQGVDGADGGRWQLGQPFGPESGPFRAVG